MSEHTPGPWRYVFEQAANGDETALQNFSVMAGDDSIISGCGCCHSPWCASEADARLIASAPDLKAEVERLRAELARRTTLNPAKEMLGWTPKEPK